MRVFGVVLLFFTASLHAETCGLYQIEDFGDRTLYSITDFTSQNGQTVSSSIVNFLSPEVKNMVAGQCYCVEGPSSEDPQYQRDLMFRILRVEVITRGPYTGCQE
jgi:hypothetical protein